MSVLWAKTDDVEERLPTTTSARSFTADDIQTRLQRAHDEIRTKLQATISASILNSWTQETVPKMVKDWVADLAGAFVLSDYYSEGLLDKTTHAGSLYGKVQQDLKDVQNGILQIVDPAGDSVSPAADLIKSDKEGKTPFYTMNNPADSTFGEGSLDEW